MTTQELRSYIDRILGNSLRVLLPSYWWKRLFGATIDTVDDVSKSVAKMSKDINEKLENMSSYEEITYAELYKKQSKEELIPNRLYRITDYRCSLGPQVKNAVLADYDKFANFNIIVRALTNSRLDENARATDVVGTSTGYNKASWEIKYSMENDIKKFPWASYGDLEVELAVSYESKNGTVYACFVWMDEYNRYESDRCVVRDFLVNYPTLVSSIDSTNTLGKTTFNRGEKVYVLDKDRGGTYEATVLYTKEMKNTGEGVLIGTRWYDPSINSYEAFIWNGKENAYIGTQRGRKLCGEDYKILEKQNSFEPYMSVKDYYISNSGVNTYTSGLATVGFDVPLGTGVVYYMKDANNNVAFYDFKQIKFLIPGEDTPRFTFEDYRGDGSSDYRVFANNYIENCGGLNGVSLYAKYSDIKFNNNYIASTVTDVCFKQSLSNKHIGTDNEGNIQTINIFDIDAKVYDDSMSATSTNAVQNRVVKAYVDDKTKDITDLKGLTFTVAFDAQLNDTTTDEEKAANKSNLMTYLQDVQTGKSYQIYLNAYMRDSKVQYRIKVNPSYIGPAMLYNRAYSGDKMIFAKLDLGDVFAGLNYDLILDKNEGSELVPHIDGFETNMVIAILTSDNKVTTDGLASVPLRQNQAIYKHVVSDNRHAPIALYLTRENTLQFIPARVEKSSDVLYIYAGDYSLTLNSDGTVTEL